MATGIVLQDNEAALVLDLDTKKYRIYFPKKDDEVNVDEDLVLLTAHMIRCQGDDEKYRQELYKWFTKGSIKHG